MYVVQWYSSVIDQWLDIKTFRVQWFARRYIARRITSRKYVPRWRILLVKDGVTPDAYIRGYSTSTKEFGTVVMELQRK